MGYRKNRAGMKIVKQQFYIVLIIVLISIISIFAGWQLGKNKNFNENNSNHSTSSSIRIVMVGSGDFIQGVFHSFQKGFSSEIYNGFDSIAYYTFNIPFDSQSIAKTLNEIEHIDPTMIIVGQSYYRDVVNRFRNTPIIVTLASDVVSLGLADSSERGGVKNVAFIDNQNIQSAPTRLELYLQMMPYTDNILVLRGSNIKLGENPSAVPELKVVAEKYGAKIIDKAFDNREDLAEFINTYDFSNVDVIFRYPGTFMAANIDLVFDANRKLRKPIITLYKNEMEKGGIISYSPSAEEIGDRAAGAALQIIRNSTRPEDLPVYYILKPEFGINLRVAEALGIKVPMSFIERADYLGQ